MENTNEMQIIFDSYSSNESFARVAVADANPEYSCCLKEGCCDVARFRREDTCACRRYC